MRRREPVSHHHLPARPGARGGAPGGQDPVERMSTSDLAALRTLVGAVGRRRDMLAALAVHQRTCRDCQTGRPSSPCASLALTGELRMAMEEIDIALPAAQEALERVEDEPNPERTRSIMLSARWNETNRQLDEAHAHIARLEEALRVAKRTIRTWSEMGAREPEEHLEETWLLYQKSPEMKRINEALEGRDE